LVVIEKCLIPTEEIGHLVAYITENVRYLQGYKSVDPVVKNFTGVYVK